MQCVYLSLLLHSMLLTHVLSSRGLYDELRLLGGACPPRDTCRALGNPEDDHLWGNRTCECGSHCIRRNTCCIDSPHAGRFYVHPPAEETCQKVPTTKFAVRMISNCSPRERNRDLLQKCIQSEESDLRDPLMAAPVTSRTSQRTYKNYFCALCNHDAEDSVLWNIDVQGVRPSDVSSGDVTELASRLAFDAAEGSWGVLAKDQDSFQKVKLSFVVPSSLRKIVKKCYSTMVTVCHVSQENSVLHHKCLAYYAPVRLRQGEWRPKFRNVHCGLCNNASAAGVEDDTCVLETSERKKRPKLSFALLLDVNTENGDLVGRVEVCKNGEVMDPFFKKCRSMKCVLPNYVIKDRTCVKAE